LVGDFDAKEMEALLKSSFGDWKSRVSYVRLPNPAPVAKPASFSFETPDKANAMVLSVLPLKVQDSDPDFTTLTVIEEILGGSSHSRLMERLRQKDGLSYSAGTQLQASSFEPKAELLFYSIYAPQNLEKIKLGTKEELERFVRDGVTESELVDAKTSIMQARQTGRAQDAGLATLLVRHLRAGRTMAFSAQSDAQIQAVSLAQVNAVIRKYIDPTRLVHIYAGDFAGASKKAAQPVTAQP